MENIDFTNRTQRVMFGSLLNLVSTLPSVVLIHLLQVDMYFTCHVTPKTHSLEMSCIFMGGSSSQHVATLKSLVTKGILIVRGKMLHQKRGSYRYVLPLKN